MGKCHSLAVPRDMKHERKLRALLSRRESAFYSFLMCKMLKYLETCSVNKRARSSLIANIAKWAINDMVLMVSRMDLDYVNNNIIGESIYEWLLHYIHDCIGVECIERWRSFTKTESGFVFVFEEAFRRLCHGTNIARGDSPT